MLLQIQPPWKNTTKNTHPTTLTISWKCCPKLAAKKSKITVIPLKFKRLYLAIKVVQKLAKYYKNVTVSIFGKYIKKPNKIQYLRKV